MTDDWIHWIEFAAGWGTLLAAALLAVASYLHYRGTGSRLLLMACVGFVLVVGSQLYSAFLAFYPPDFSTIEGMRVQMTLIAYRAAWVGFSSALGFTIAGVAYLLFVFGAGRSRR
jgi:hypothetical protein